jgi:hypothetical protein
MRGVAWWDDRATSGPSGRLLRRSTWNAPAPATLLTLRSLTSEVSRARCQTPRNGRQVCPFTSGPPGSRTCHDVLRPACEGPDTSSFTWNKDSPALGARKCHRGNKGSGISFEDVAEETASPGAPRDGHVASKQQDERTCVRNDLQRFSERARGPLWETWGKQRASGFPQWFRRVPVGRFPRACGETGDFWNAAGG